MRSLINKNTKLKMLKKHNKFQYWSYQVHLKSGKYLLIPTILLIIYFIFRYFKFNKPVDTSGFNNLSMNKVNYNENNSYKVNKDGTKLSENNYMDEYYRNIPTRVLPPRV